MKKNKVAMLGLFLVLGLAACGKEAEVTITEESNVALEATIEQTQEEISTTEAATEVSTEVESVEEEITYEPMQEIIDAEWHSGLVQINDMLIQLPIRLSELVELGFDYTAYEQSKDYLYSKGEKKPISIYLNGEEITFSPFTSTTDGFHTLEELDPYVYYMRGDRVYENIKIYFPGGIQVGDSYKVIEEKLGTPREISSNMTYVYGNFLSYNMGMEIEVNKDTQSIQKIYYAMQENLNRDITLAPITLEEVNSLNTNSKHTVSMNFFENYILNQPDNYFDYEYGRIHYAVIKGEEVIQGLFDFYNMSEKKEENSVEIFLELMTEIVKSIEF